MFKKEKGITLVALVVTIVVLLILAGVSISLVLDQNGIINKRIPIAGNGLIQQQTENPDTAEREPCHAYLRNQQQQNG